MPGLVHQKYGLAIPAECTQRETTPPLLCCKATFAGEKTIFSMDKRKHTRSGGRQPAVVRDKLAVPRESSYVRQLENTRNQLRRTSARCDSESEYPGGVR